MMKCCAVIDTNVLVSALLSSHDDAAYLVTGNTRHFPKKPFIVTAREFLDILDQLNSV